MVRVIVKTGNISKEYNVRKKAKFAKKLNYIVKDLLRSEFKIKKSFINEHCVDNINLKFANGTTSHGTVTEIKEDLTFKIAYKVFVTYEEEKRNLDIIDEPKGTADFIQFKDLLYSRVNYSDMLTDYFKKELFLAIVSAGVKTHMSK